MANTMNDTRTPGEILADAVKLAEKTGHSYITVTNQCAERIIELLKEQEKEIDEISDEYLDLGKEMAKQPKPKTGHWIRNSVVNMFGGVEIVCSVCGNVIIRTDVNAEHFCSNCGAKMEKQP